VVHVGKRRRTVCVPNAFFVQIAAMDTVIN
jgi:hypothetical protein